MACFPRLFHQRSKNKFTPAVDENRDTILNTQDNPVQIGLYIRREETQLYTALSSPSGSEAQLQRLKQQQQWHQQPATPTGSLQLQYTDNSNGGVFNAGSSSSNNNSLQRQPKKFRSNRDKQQLAAGAAPAPAVANAVSSQAINVTRSNSKLKPVKERRPTALPTEAPSLLPDVDDVDDVDEHGARQMVAACCFDVVDDGTDFAAAKPKLQVNVNGIIDESDGMFQTTTTTTATTTATRTGSISKPATPTIVKFFIGHTQEPHTDETDDALYWRASHGNANGSSNDNNNNNKNNNNNSSSNIKLTNGTLPQAEPGQRLPVKCFSNMSLNYLTKCKNLDSSTAGNSSKSNGQQQRVSTMPHIYIPPPPPMPDKLLAPSTPLHLRKKKSVDLLKAQTEHTESSASTLNASNSQDQIATPKDSDGKSVKSSSMKAQRLEGGLIFARPNLPVQKDIEIEFNAKDETTRNLIHKAIDGNDFLNNLMDKERKEMVINAMAPANYDKNSYIINEQEEGSEIYVSAEGYYDVYKGGQHVGHFGPATVFGELAILYNAPRQATIRAATDARVWKITRETFRAIMQISGSKEREENLQFLRSAPFLQELEESLLSRVVDLLQRKFYETGSCIVREGEVGNEFFIIRGGTVTIKKRDAAQQEQVVAKRKRGDYFGERALMNADRRQASVYADAPGTEVLKLDREAFTSYLGEIKQLREKHDDRDDTQGRTSNKSVEFDNEHAHIAISELKKIATLGAGAFGRVDLVTHNGQTYALKIIKKIEVVKQDQIEHVYNEKNVMIKCRNSPFIVQLYRTYRNEKYVYFLMEACMGGDVWTVMSKRQHFDDKTAKFIAGCVVEAFDFLHSHNFIYRDLKPENLMLSTDGYCKLVDFGFAKYVRANEKTNTFAGTPEYVAPEIILDRGHDRAVDYWALGILIFELLVGKTPFRGVNQIKIYQQILSGIDVIHMPTRIPKSAQHLIRHLCKQLPAERLGYQRKGIADIKRHSWFESLDWAKLKAKQLPSPIKRVLKSPTDLQYFGPSGVETDYEPPEELSGWDNEF